MRMRSITAYEHSVVKCILLSDSLANWIDREPFDPVPFEVVWLENVLRLLLYLLNRGRLPRVPIFIRRRRDLHIQANHIFFSRNDHDRPVV